MRYAQSPMAETQPDTSHVEIVDNGSGAARGVGCIGLISIIMMLFAAVAAADLEPKDDLAITGLGTNTADGEDYETDLTPTPTSSPALAVIEPVPTRRPTQVPSPAPTIVATREPEPARKEQSAAAALPADPPEPTSVPATADFIEQTILEQDAFSAAPPPTPTGNMSFTLKVPILMYHYISEPPVNADKYRLDLSVSPSSFREQMNYLRDNGFTTIDLYDLSRAIAGKIQLPEKPIIITLDDGYLDNYINAFPVLKELGLSATFFLATGFLDDKNPNYMDWPMVEEMARAGMRIEPHSKNHPDLRGRERLFLIYEILGSQETIEAHIGEKPRYFAYPSGRYDEDVINILVELDLWGAVTTETGQWHGFNDRYLWTRIRIRNVTTMADFVDLVN